jgi:serine/threonine protein kinase
MGFILAGILTGKPLWTGHDREKLLGGIYKVTGTPAKSNYEIAAKYPYYKKPEKKYGERVVKVLQQQLQDRAPEFEKEIDLVSQMLRLDPDDRCTVEQALSHEVMKEYEEMSRSDDFRAWFARDWLALKKSVITMSRKVAEDDYRKHQVAVAMAPSRAAHPDDLYAMDDLLSPSPSNKKAKYDHNSD